MTRALLKSVRTLTPEERELLHAELAAKEEADYQECKDSQWENLCPPIYRESLNFAKIEPKNHDKIKAIVAWDNYPKGLVIIGPTGRAKTRACWHAIKPLWYAGKTVHYASSFKMSQDAVRALTDHENGYKITNRYVGAGILFLDDLGKRPTPSLCQFLFEIIERRTSSNLPIVVTSNETLITLGERIDDPTMSAPIIRRLEDFCDKFMLP